jgi:D-alanyl-D-alanine dipeptidase
MRLCERKNQRFHLIYRNFQEDSEAFMRPYSILTASMLALSAAVQIPGEAHGVQSPFAGARQLVLVVAETDSTPRARLSAFSREGGRWNPVFSCPAVVGKNGMGWGRGLQRDSDSDPAEPVKREGDGKSPMGAFALLCAWGYPPRDSVRTSFPYEQTTPDLVCIDDARSEFYNLVMSKKAATSGVDSIPSREDMLRPDDLYRYVIIIGYNTPKTVPGAGSCIFLHVWRGEDSFTAGCTAVAEEEIVRLLGWLDPAKKPVIVQLTWRSCERLRGRWGLPEGDNFELRR